MPCGLFYKMHCLLPWQYNADTFAFVLMLQLRDDVSHQWEEKQNYEAAVFHIKNNVVTVQGMQDTLKNQ